ncbi:MAG: NAD(P)H-hydrate dehydratase [Deltaproteobacteria bacterium]|nr:NAD(P)H-hydrate dehydratase [Deltaproteobacteria bacterium]
MLVVTAEEMRILDRRTIEEVGVPGSVLMENAGRTAYQIADRCFGPFRGKRICVLAGRGNNGGDGFVLARYFFEDEARVQVFLLSSMDRVTGDARINLDICRKLGVPIHEVLSEDDLPASETQWAHAYLLVDALLGTGLSSEVRGLYGKAIQAMNRFPAKVLAVDIPSGLDSNRGVALGEAVQADVTVTFGLPKIGQVIYPGRALTGALYCANISIPRRLIGELEVVRELLTFEGIRLPEERNPAGHKGNFGHLFVLAGSTGKTGAADLVCRSAAHVGTGLVTLGIPRSLNSIMEIKLTEPMTEPLPETAEACLGMVSLESIMGIMERKTALALGPGISTRPETAELVRELVRSSPLPVVLDADGLTAISDDTRVLKQARSPLILTPHPGEMARMTKLSTVEIQADRPAAARTFAREHGVYLVLKGARTLIAYPDGSLFINSTGNPGLATGGSGDVLTGIIAGFLALGLPPGEAAKTGVFLHGWTADWIAARKAPVGYLAGDVCEALPECLARLESRRKEPGDTPLVPLVTTVP